MPAADRGQLPPEVAEAVQRIDGLIQAFEAHPYDRIREMAAELLACVDALHRRGVERLAAYLAEADDQIKARALADPPVRLLFQLYDLLPDNPGGFVPLEELDGAAGEQP